MQLACWKWMGGGGQRSSEDALPKGRAGPQGSARRALGALLVLCKRNISAKQKATPFLSPRREGEVPAAPWAPATSLFTVPLLNILRFHPVN